MKLSQLEVNERIDYVLKLARLGISRFEIQNRITQKYNCGLTQARIWYNRGVDSLIIVDDEKPRTRAMILEIIHSQLVGFQQDLGKISDRINAMDANEDRAKMVTEQLSIVTDPTQLKALGKELKSIPYHSTKIYLDAIESRSKTRERIIKCCIEIGRLHGLYVEEMPIIKAIQVMAQSELIPAQVGADLLTLISGFERKLDAVSLN